MKLLAASRIHERLVFISLLSLPSTRRTGNHNFGWTLTVYEREVWHPWVKVSWHFSLLNCTLWYDLELIRYELEELRVCNCKVYIRFNITFWITASTSLLWYNADMYIHQSVQPLNQLLREYADYSNTHKKNCYWAEGNVSISPVQGTIFLRKVENHLQSS